MKQLIEVPLNDGSSVIVEVEETESEGVVRAGRGEVIAKAAQTLEAALDRVRPTASVVIAKLRDLAVTPSEISVEFGLKFSAKAGVYIASADTEANFKVSLKWTRKEQ